MTRNCYKILKKASTVSDYVSGLPTGVALNVLDNVTGLPFGSALGMGLGVGNIAGQFDKPNASKEELIKALQELDESQLKALIPGVAQHRMGKRMQFVQRLMEDRDKTKGSSTKSRFWHQLSVLNPVNALSALPASIAAGLTKTKSLKEVADTTNDPNYGLKSWFVPGWKIYQDLKALGASDKISGTSYTEDEVKELQDEDLKKLLLKELREKRKVKKA